MVSQQTVFRKIRIFLYRVRTIPLVRTKFLLASLQHFLPGQAVSYLRPAPVRWWYITFDISKRHTASLFCMELLTFCAKSDKTFGRRRTPVIRKKFPRKGKLLLKTDARGARRYKLSQNVPIRSDSNRLISFT